MTFANASQQARRRLALAMACSSILATTPPLEAQTPSSLPDLQLPDPKIVEVYRGNWQNTLGPCRTIATTSGNPGAQDEPDRPWRVDVHGRYPGWYPGRTPHIHFKVLIDEKNLVTGQLYFPDALSARIYRAGAPYSERKAARDILSNENDFIFADQGGGDTLVDLTEEGGSYRGALIIGVAASGDRRAEQTLMLKIVSGGQTGVDRSRRRHRARARLWRLVP